MNTQCQHYPCWLQWEDESKCNEECEMQNMTCEKNCGNIIGEECADTGRELNGNSCPCKSFMDA